MTVTQPSGVARGRTHASARGLLSMATLVTGLLVVTVWSYPYRELEAALAAHVTGLVTPSFSFGDRWVVEPIGGKSLMLVVTGSCTTSLLVAPLFVAAVWALLLRRLRVSMTLVGLVLGIGILLALGTIRMAVIGLSWHRWGVVSAWVSHDLVGTLITISSAALALGTMLTIAARGSRVTRREFTDDAVPGGR